MSNHPRNAAEGRPTCRKFLPLAAALVLLVVGLPATAPQPAGAQVFTSNVVISQIYTRGGEPGAAYQSDFVELFNRGNSSVDINGYALQVTAVEGTSTRGSLMTFISSRGIVIEPGKYVLIELARGSQGQPLPSPDFPSGSFALNLGSTGGHVALYRKAPVFQFGSCPSGTDLADMVGYGAGATCWEGDGPAAVAPDAASALLRTRGGCDDNSSSAADFQTGAPNPRNSSTPKSLCVLPSGSSTINFALPQFNVPESEGRFTVTVTRTGETLSPASVEYSVSDGTADERQDYTTALGTLRFAPGETLKTFDVLLTDDADAESNETVSLALGNPTGAATLGPRNTATLVLHDNDSGAASFNPADDPQFFARQHYHDFLNREPDGPGLFFWTNQITECGADAACAEVRRINVSAAFFESVEFQETGFLVHRIYRAAFAPSAQRPRGLPRFREFVRDTQEMGRGVVVGVGDWRLRLDTNQRSFVEEFVSRAEFRALYPATMTAAEYVDALNQNAGGVISTQLREQMIFNLNSGAFTRAEVLRMVAENRQFTAAEKNRARVLMQYFGYLRRNPDDAPQPGLDFSGYDFWLRKLDEHGGDFIAAEMVKAFITSPEYLGRFASRQ